MDFGAELSDYIMSESFYLVNFFVSSSHERRVGFWVQKVIAYI